MARIILNKEIELEGAATISQRIENDEIVIEGLLTLSKYIPRITSVDTLKFTCDKIIVIEESFGTEDDLFGYRFIAQNLIIKNEGEMYHVK